MKKFWIMLMLISNVVVAKQQTPAIPVVLDTVKRTEVVATMPVTGNVYSQNDTQVTAAVSGQLVFIAEPGTIVKQGDVVVSIDTAALQLQQLEQQALIARAEAQLKYLETNLKRQQDLVKAKTVSANTVDQTQSQRDVAASDLAVAKIRLQQIEEQLDRSTITAPFDGVVSSRLRSIGETVVAGTALGSLTDLTHLEIRAQVPLKYVNHIHIGQQLTIHAFGIEQSAIVQSLVPSGQSRQHAYEMRLAFENLNRMSIGQLVSVAVPVNAIQSSLVVNQDALVLRENGTFVFKVKADKTVEQVLVKANENIGEMIAIQAELEDGDQVVIRGADGLRTGVLIQAQQG